MMTCDLTCLDYVWRGLLVGTLTASIVLSILLATWILLRNKMTCLQNKWFLNFHLLALFSVLLAAFGFVAIKDPELASGCFRRFLSQGVSFSFTRFVAGAWFAIFTGLILFDLFRIYATFKRAKSFRLVMDPFLNNRLQAVLIKMNYRHNVKL